MTCGRTHLLLLAATLAARAALPPPIDESVRVAVPGSVHPRVADRIPVGPVDPSLPLERMLLVLTPAPEVQAARERFLKALQDLASPDYHRWLTPAGYGARFGPDPAQVDAAARWLTGHGLRVDAVAPSGQTITFSGPAGQVEEAFATAILEFQVDGVRHRANATPVSIPAALAGSVAGVVSLGDFRRGHPHVRSRPEGVDPLDGANAIGALDYAAIYDLGPAYAAGLTGTGVTIGVVGRTQIPPGDNALFQALQDASPSRYTGSLQIQANGPDPGFLDGDEQLEAEIDTQWTRATAPGADVLLVVSPTSATTDGIDLSAQYLVENNAAPVLSTSFGACEQDLGSSGNTFYSQLWSQAAAQGITVLAAAGDSGAAGCDDPVDFTGTGRAVSGIAATPYDVAVGGTMFIEGGSSAYWGTPVGLGSNPRTAIGYIPETAWNESSSNTGGYRLYAGGGGVSTVYAKPDWQAGLTPADGYRDLPDLALDSGALHDPFMVELGGTLTYVGGTSVATPCMAGIMALVVQKFGRQGCINPTLYGLATKPVFHDITTGDNWVPGVPGYSAGVGFDLCTGLGSPDAWALVGNWPAPYVPVIVTATITTPTPTYGRIASGTSLPFNGTGTDSAGNPLAYVWSFGDGGTAAGTSASHVFLNATGQVQTFQVSLTASDGANYGVAFVPVLVNPASLYAAILTPVTDADILPGVAIAFSGTATPSPGAAITSYAWDFGDGATAATASASHTFAENDHAPYLVTFTARDSAGASAKAAMKVLADSPLVLDTAGKFDTGGNPEVDVRSLLRVAAAWNPTTQATAQEHAGLVVACDLNADGTVDDTDLTLWMNAFDLVMP